MMRIKKVEVIV